MKKILRERENGTLHGALPVHKKDARKHVCSNPHSTSFNSQHLTCKTQTIFRSFSTSHLRPDGRGGLEQSRCVTLIVINKMEGTMTRQEGEGCDDCPDHTVSLIYCTQMGAETQAVKESQPAVVCVITNTNNGDLNRFVRSIKELSNGSLQDPCSLQNHFKGHTLNQPEPARKEGLSH